MSISQYFVPENESSTDSAPSFEQLVAPGVVSFQLPPFIFSSTEVAQDGGMEVSLSPPSPASWYHSNAGVDDSFLSSLSAIFTSELAMPPPPEANSRSGQSSTGPIAPTADFLNAPRPPSQPTTTTTPPDPSPYGLPIYSASGFDVLNLLSRVATRRNPKITLGPVDLSCSFVVVDVRRYDNPIVYCSPSFCKLTGYEECDILGRNCRFLQAPDGLVQRGQHRQYTSQEPVAHLRKYLSADKECQTSLINFRKGGQAFMNLVTVIPITGGISGVDEDPSSVVFHIGFQVDLTEQPNRIMAKLKEGSYLASYRSPCDPQAPPPYLVGVGRDRRDRLRRLPGAMSKDLRVQLANPAFVDSIPLTITTTPATTPYSPAGAALGDRLNHDGKDSNQLLNLILLESTPDFIHVLSLKGSFLYVAPSVRRVLGYQPDELVGKSVADFCHPADVIPLMRELKESSTSPALAHDSTSNAQPPKSVDLLYRAREKSGSFVWVEARGRLFVEPGKGRKAIILSGRSRRMQRLDWAAVNTGEDPEADQAFWACLCPEGTFLVVGSAVRDVLGWSVTEVMGRTLAAFVVPDGTTSLQDEVGKLAHDAGASEPRKFWVKMARKDGSHVAVAAVLYRPIDDGFGPSLVICHIRVARAPGPFDPVVRPPQPVYPGTANVFEELDTSRGSSWQYELQQLKFSNQRLVEEIAMLEGQGSPQTPQDQASPMCALPSSNHSNQEWLQNTYFHSPTAPSLKRAWHHPY